MKTSVILACVLATSSATIVLGAPAYSSQLSATGARHSPQFYADEYAANAQDEDEEGEYNKYTDEEEEEVNVAPSAYRRPSTTPSYSPPSSSGYRPQLQAQKAAFSRQQYSQPQPQPDLSDDVSEYEQYVDEEDEQQSQERPVTSVKPPKETYSESKAKTAGVATTGAASTAAATQANRQEEDADVFDATPSKENIVRLNSGPVSAKSEPQQAQEQSETTTPPSSPVRKTKQTMSDVSAEEEPMERVPVEKPATKEATTAEEELPKPEEKTSIIGMLLKNCPRLAEPFNKWSFGTIKGFLKGDFCGKQEAAESEKSPADVAPSA